MRISDWSSDVCSSDLLGRHRFHAAIGGVERSFKLHIACFERPYLELQRIEAIEDGVTCWRWGHGCIGATLRYQFIKDTWPFRGLILRECRCCNGERKQARAHKIGRAARGERVWQSASISVDGV